MCVVLNYEVLFLKWILIGNIKFGYLKCGEWWELNREEISYLNDL